MLEKGFDSNDILKNVASIAANNDDELGGLIAQVIEIEGEDKPACVAETLGVLYPSN